MRSNVGARQLRLCNTQLGIQPTVRYASFLEQLLRSNPCSEASELLPYVLKGDFRGLLDTADSISSREFPTALEHYRANQFCSVIRKYPFSDDESGYSPRRTATAAFLSSEHKCARVNTRFRLFRNLRSPHEYELETARAWIEKTIGVEPDISDLGRYCRFGPGASLGVHGNSTSMGAKLLAKRWTCTPSAFYLARAVMREDFHVRELLHGARADVPAPLSPLEFNKLFEAKVELVDYNKITFVPKTAKTERTIAVEPLLNGFLQLGVDALLRQKLKRVGIDLSDQSLNQALARRGSLDDNDPWVTIDLSAASDSISTELCRFLLPPEWFAFLNQLRCHSYAIDGVKSPYQKFVTMGNGFCFPLETLIFASLCQASSTLAGTGYDGFLVYGDDLIVRQSLAPVLLRLLGVCGFKPNLAKTFLKGPFRESCGADWYSMDDVRPITLDYPLDSVENLIKFYNMTGSKERWESFFYETREFIRELIPPEVRFCRPYKGQVDTALEVPLDVFLGSPFCRWDRTFQSYRWLEIRKSSVYDSSLTECVGYESAVMRGALAGLKSNPARGYFGASCPSPFTVRRETRTKIRSIAYSGASSNWTPA